MTIQEIIAKLKLIKENYANGDLSGDGVIENIEDIVYDVEGNDGMSFSDNEDHYGSFEETDFTKLEVF